MFWIIGKTGVLARAFYRFFTSHQIPFFISSKEECDITNWTKVRQYIKGKKSQYIINCSAYTAVDLAETCSQEAYLLNITGVEHVARAAELLGAKVIHFSTDYVFDGKKHEPYTEQDQPSPLNIYGKSKLQGEEVLQTMLPSSLIVRISWLFSREGPSFMRRIWEVMEKQTEVHVVASQIGKPTYADDVVTAIMELLECVGVYHFANQDAVSRYVFAQEIFSELKNHSVCLKCEQILPSVTVHGLAIRPEYSVLGTDKTEQKLNRPIRSHRAALRECIELITGKERTGVT